MNELKKFVDGYLDCVEQNLALRREPDTRKDWYHGETSSVLGGLLARQMTLTIYLAMSPNCWNGHIAPLFLRSMIDAHISMAWILQDPIRRSKEYVSYGLGQEKLSLGHLKAKSESQPDDHYLKDMIEAKEEWISRHTMLALLEVNLGSWSGSSVRKMCQDIDDEDFYHFSFTPFSACVHNSWHHINLYNNWPCTNPLHKEHFVPNIIEIGIDFDFLFRSAKYASMSIEAFDAALELSHDFILPKTWVLQNEPQLDIDEREEGQT